MPGLIFKEVVKYLRKGRQEKECVSKEGPSPDFKIGKEPPIKVDALVNKFREIIQSHPEITPTLGKEHTWSPEAKQHLRFGFFKRLGGFIKGKNDFPAPLLGTSKLFLMLACGYTSEFAVTGNEKPLYDKLMNYKDHSVKMDDVLRESYVLNRGDLYQTLLTAENVLSRGLWNPDRANLPLQKKLEYIRNDSTPEGDNFGAWYHFTGIALYGLLRNPLMAKTVGNIEALGSLFMEKPDKQETYMNRLGAEFGSKLREMLDKGTWKNPVSPLEDTNYRHRPANCGYLSAKE